ncbi:ABC-three component system middle component 2 [Streptosporangium sp. NPDC001681]|uniref:ABC-three component system middle component 2 n=1 Tax=Streptosporangium sp. NPDC001681 TaxID=3154395 RepID=UPI00332A8E13
MEASDRTDFRPEDDITFRLAQLLLLLDALDEQDWLPSLERLGVMDFFAAHPFLVISKEDNDYKRLMLAGFSVRSLTYASPGQRFVTRRSRLQHDLSLLVAYGLTGVGIDQGSIVYSITSKGKDLADQLGSIYAQSYKTSVEIVGARIKPLTDVKLQDRCREWLRADPSLLDLLNI